MVDPDSARILIVDDEERFAASLASGLRAHGLRVEVVGDGRSGLELASRESFDCIVLDLLLPQLNGYLVCRELRKRGVRTPIIVLTAKTGRLDEVEVLETGADDFLRKPFALDVLVARVRALLRRSAVHEAAPPDRGFGSIVLDPIGRTVVCEGVRLGLAPIGVDLLEILLENRDRFTSKSELIERVWADDPALDGNVVEAHISRIRRSLAGAGSSARIETKWKSGYRLVMK